MAHRRIESLAIPPIKRFAEELLGKSRWMRATQWYFDTSDWLFMTLRQPHNQLAFFQSTAFAAALLWLIHRAWQIYRKPLKELVDVLGIDVPPVPDLSLAGIAADKVLLYWKPQENLHTGLKYTVQVNGVTVGECSRGDAAVEVIGLRPGHYYNIRVVVSNPANLTTLGPLIRIRTKTSAAPASTSSLNDTYNHEQVSTAISNFDEPAAVRSAAGPYIDDSSSGPPHAIIRESSGSHQNARRSMTGRRNSPASANQEAAAGQAAPRAGFHDDDDNLGESELTLKKLTEKLDELRRELEQVEGQIAEEEDDYEAMRTALSGERDSLKQALKEREDASSELKKQVANLDKINRTTQSKKSAKEKVLQQKLAERQRMKDDLARWDEELGEMGKDITDMEREKLAVIDGKEEKISDIRETMQEGHAMIRSLEDEIRVKGIQIKSLDRDRKPSDDDQVAEERDSGKDGREQEQTWEVRMQALQRKYTSLWQTLQQVEGNYHQAQERLGWWVTKRARDPTQFAPISALDYSSSVQASRQRRTRHPSSRNSTISSLSGPHQVAPPAHSSISNISPSFSTASTFFNMGNGTTVPSTLDFAGSSHAEAEIANGTVPTSPTANALLPSNLFREDDLPAPRLVASGSDNLSNIFSDPFSSLGPLGTDAGSYGPQSPVSSNSRSPSVFSSPHDGLNKIYSHQQGTDVVLDSDRHSVNSTNVSYPSQATEANPIAARRLASLFNFNRQRGKSTADELPALGTLKQGQSQSFPRNLEQGTLDPIGTQRRRGSYGNWANPMANFLTRNSSLPVDATEANRPGTSRLGVGRRSRLNVFNSKYDSLDPSTYLDKTPSPRPSSMYSIENTLPRPSTESQPFGWPMPDALLHRTSRLGLDWSSSGGPWSRGTSRRQSAQHGSTSNLSLGSTPIDMDDYHSLHQQKTSPPAPIGTRPQSSRRPPTPRLNPTAPTFKTLFGRSDTKKNTKADKSVEKTAEKIKERGSEEAKDTDVDSQSEDSPAAQPRLSKDSPSVVTATSMAESRESLDRSTSGTPSEAAATSSGPKETLMQRITRKSSSSKFNVPWGKDRGGIFSKKAGEPFTPGEMDEDASSEGNLGKGVDSTASTPQQEKGSRSSISWTNIMRKSRKGDKASIEGAERMSETTDEDEI